MIQDPSKIVQMGDIMIFFIMMEKTPAMLEHVYRDLALRAF